MIKSLEKRLVGEGGFRKVEVLGHVKGLNVEWSFKGACGKGRG
jgi:hypothetical protein